MTASRKPNVLLSDHDIEGSSDVNKRHVLILSVPVYIHLPRFYVYMMISMGWWSNSTPDDRRKPKTLKADSALPWVNQDSLPVSFACMKLLPLYMPSNACSPLTCARRATKRLGGNPCST